MLTVGGRGSVVPVGCVVAKLIPSSSQDAGLLSLGDCSRDTGRFTDGQLKA